MTPYFLITNLLRQLEGLLVSKIAIAILIGLSVIIAIFAPLIVDPNIWGLIDFRLKIISACATLITLFIAFLLYDRFSIKQRVLDKQFDLIVEFLTKMKNLGIVMNHNGKLIGFPIDRDGFKNFKSLELDKFPMIFEQSYISDLMELTSLSYNPMLPREIIDKCKIVRFSQWEQYYHKDKIAMDHQYVIAITVIGDKPLVVGTIGHKEVTVAEFILGWESAIDALEKWIRENSSRDLELNI